MHTDLPAHPQAILQMNVGHIIPGFPSMGSWLTYGLGTENRNLPGFIALCAGMPDVGPQLWGSAFLPAVNQGTYVPNDETDPEKMIQHLLNKRLNRAEQRRDLDLLAKLNRLDLERKGPDAQLEGRIESMEVAYRMQAEAIGCVRCIEGERGHPAALRRSRRRSTRRRSRSNRRRGTATSRAAA